VGSKFRNSSVYLVPSVRLELYFRACSQVRNPVYQRKVITVVHGSYL